MPLTFDCRLPRSRAQVKNDAAARNRLSQRPTVAEFAFDQRYAIESEARELCSASVVADKNAWPRSTFDEQPLDEPPPEKAGAAGDEDVGIFKPRENVGNVGCGSRTVECAFWNAVKHVFARNTESRVDRAAAWRRSSVG
jgi:hypothetical protein